MALRSLLLVLLLTITLTGFGQRGVLLEKYTSAWCGLCPDAHLTVDDLLASYPTLIPVLHHSSVDGMGNPDSQEWFQGFNIPGTPRGVVDRKGEDPLSMSALPHQWEARIQQRLDQPAPLDISVAASYQPDDRTLAIDVEATFSEAPPGGELRLNVMIVEDSVIGSGPGWDQSSYFNDPPGHPLEGLGNPLYDYPHRHVLREVLDGAWGTEGVFPENPAPGTPYQHNYQYAVPEEYQSEKLRVVAFVSRFHPTVLTQREVLNAEALDYADFSILSHTTEPKAAPRLVVFPNPAGSTVGVRLEGVDHAGAELLLLDGSGRIIRQFRYLGGNRQLDISGLPAGLYLLQLSGPEGVARRRLLVTQ